MLHNEISLAVSAGRMPTVDWRECFSTPCAIEQTMRAWVTAAAAAAAAVSASKTHIGSQCRVHSAYKETCYERLFLRRVYIIPALNSNWVRYSNRIEILHSACSIICCCQTYLHTSHAAPLFCDRGMLGSPLPFPSSLFPSLPYLSPPLALLSRPSSPPFP